jgi:hypothetical protein
VRHRTVRCASGATARQRNSRLTTAQCADSSRRVRAAPEGAPDSEQWRFGAAPDCPVPQDVRAPTVETVRTLTVGWRGWRTGQCPVRPSTTALSNSCFGGWGYKYSPTTTNQGIQVFSHCIQYKSSRLHSKTQTRDQILSQVQDHSIHLVTSEREIFVFIWVLVAWIAFLLPHSCSQDICNQSKRHQLCGGPCGI